jgi:VWFA-related protein
MKNIPSAIFLFAALSQAQDRETPIKVDVDVVNVLCTVSDQRGTLVTDLKKEDFEIQEDKKPQQIRYFARETDLPLSIALLLDVSGSVNRFVESEKDVAAQFIKEVLRPQDQALLVGFSSTIVLWQDFTSSAELLAASLQRLRPVVFRGLPPLGQPMPGTLLYDAVLGTASDKLQNIAGRKVMVVISDGLDNGSRLHLDDAVKGVQTTNAIVYSICYDGGFSGCSYMKSMSEPTGGRMFQAGKRTLLSKIFQTIQEELRSQYAIGYVPTNRAHDGTFRKLEVKVHRKGLKLEVRRGYYARKDVEP